jgi:thiamine transport system permease protein
MSSSKNGENSDFEVLKQIISAFLILLFLSPVVILVGSGLHPSGTFASETLSVLGYTFTQAFLSAVLALLLGLLGAYGLEAAHVRFGAANGKFLEAISLLPNVAPVLLFLLAVMKFMPGVQGLSGIVLIHALLNTGLVSVSLLRLFRSKVAGLADLAWIEGSSRFRFLIRVALPVLASDLRMIFIFVFAICFSSLAVPLVIGGSRATTLEVLVWQTLRIDGDFSRAFGIAILQVVAILGFTLILRSRTSATSNEARSAQPLLGSMWGLPVVLFPPALLIASLLDRPWVGASLFFKSDVLAGELVRGFLGSLSVALGSGFLVGGCLLLIAFVEPRGVWRRFLLGYVAPSSVITGFAILILWRETGLATYFKIMIALTLMTVPSFYRLYWDATLEALSQQRTVAMSLGASAGLTFRRIVFPQVIRPACFVAGLSSLWAWGDFALSRVVAERDVTLGMTVQSLMSSYRLEIATFLVWILLFGGAMTFFIFEGAGRVLGQKSSS